MTLTHTGGDTYSASYTVRWDPNAVILWNTASPEDHIRTTNVQTGATFGEHEKVFHGDLARHLMANDFPNVLLNGDFTLTARGADQSVRDTDPVDFTGKVISFPGMTLPTTFTVSSLPAGDVAGATAIVQAKIDETATRYLNAALEEAIIYLSHGPGYDVEGGTRYDQSDGVVITREPRLAAPQIGSRF